MLPIMLCKIVLIIFLSFVLSSCVIAPALLCLGSSADCIKNKEVSEIYKIEYRPKELQIKVDWLYFRIYANYDFEAYFSLFYFHKKNKYFYNDVIKPYHAFYDRSQKQLYEYAKSKDWFVRFAVAHNPHASEKILKKLILDDGVYSEAIKERAKARLQSTDRVVGIGAFVITFPEYEAYDLISSNSIFVERVSYYCGGFSDTAKNSFLGWKKRNNKYLEAASDWAEDRNTYQYIIDEALDKTDKFSKIKAELYVTQFISSSKNKYKACENVMDKIDSGLLDVARHNHVKHIPAKYFDKN